MHSHGHLKDHFNLVVLVVHSNRSRQIFYRKVRLYFTLSIVLAQRATFIEVRSTVAWERLLTSCLLLCIILLSRLVRISLAIVRGRLCHFSLELCQRTFDRQVIEQRWAWLKAHSHWSIRVHSSVRHLLELKVQRCFLSSYRDHEQVKGNVDNSAEDECTNHNTGQNRQSKTRSKVSQQVRPRVVHLKECVWRHYLNAATLSTPTIGSTAFLVCSKACVVYCLTSVCRSGNSIYRTV